MQVTAEAKQKQDQLQELKCKVRGGVDIMFSIGPVYTKPTLQQCLELISNGPCGCGASSHSVSTVICQFHPEPNRDITQHSLLVLPPLPQIAPVSPQWSLCARRVFHLSEHAPTERKSSSSDTSYTSHFLLSCVDSNCAWLHVHM